MREFLSDNDVPFDDRNIRRNEEARDRARGAFRGHRRAAALLARRPHRRLRPLGARGAGARVQGGRRVIEPPGNSLARRRATELIEPGDDAGRRAAGPARAHHRGDRLQRREGHCALSARHARRPPLRGGRDRRPAPPARPRRRDGRQAHRRLMELDGAPARARRPPGDHGSDPRLLLPLRQQRAGGGRGTVHRRRDGRLRPGGGHDRRVGSNRRDDRRRPRADLRGHEPPRLEHPRSRSTGADRAESVTYLYAWHRYVDGSPDGELWGRYRHAFARTEAGWRISRLAAPGGRHGRLPPGDDAPDRPPLSSD